MSQFQFEVWPTQYRVITQHFGVNPQNYAQFGLPGHEGVDIRAPNGSQIFCVASGQVRAVNTKTSHNYGIHVRVDHRDGYQTIYAHLQKALVKAGDQVQAGTVLGLADNTGNSFGAHLHLTLKLKGSKYGNWPSDIIDPTPFLLPLMGWKTPAGPFVGGWLLTAGIIVSGNLAQVNPDGVTLRSGPDQAILVPGGTIVVLAGQANQDYTPVQVPKAALGQDPPGWPTTPAPEPPPNVTTIDGWAWDKYLHLFGNQALIVTNFGINLRTKPSESSANIGVVRAGSTVSLLGDEEKGYVPVRVRRADFIGAVRLPVRPPELPEEALADLPEDVLLGWVQSSFLRREDGYAITGHRGVALRSQPQPQSEAVGMVKGDATVTVAGRDAEGFTPVLVNNQMMFDLARPRPEVQFPEPFADDSLPVMPPPVPVHSTTPGWVLTIDVAINGDEGTAESQGVMLYDAPNRNAKVTGHVPAGSKVLVMGLPYGEFVPIRADEKLVQTAPAEPDPAPYGQARIGLHASADPTISEEEHQAFAQMRPGLIKVLSFHSPADIRRLVEAHPQAGWIVRSFLEMGGRQISPSRFVTDTMPDVRRTLNELKDKTVIVELHNEPNLAREGLGTSWANGAEFADWWLDVLGRYRKVLPEVRFIYPGLSPGSSVSAVKIDHIRFLEASREAVEAADGLGVHLYWSHLYPMSRALDVLDDLIARFRFKQLWITEASNNKGQTTPAAKANQYLQFWHELQKRPVVQGVTYFVASASDPAFANEVWVGRGIARIVGAR
jgi:hypothetical protein